MCGMVVSCDSSWEGNGSIIVGLLLVVVEAVVVVWSNSTS